MTYTNELLSYLAQHPWPAVDDSQLSADYARHGWVRVPWESLSISKCHTYWIVPHYHDSKRAEAGETGDEFSIDHPHRSSGAHIGIPVI